MDKCNQCGKRVKEHVCAGLHCPYALCDVCLVQLVGGAKIAVLGEMWWCPDCTDGINLLHKETAVLLVKAVEDNLAFFVRKLCPIVPVSVRRTALRKAISDPAVCPEMTRIVLESLPKDAWLQALKNTIDARPDVDVDLAKLQVTRRLFREAFFGPE